VGGSLAISPAAAFTDGWSKNLQGFTSSGQYYSWVRACAPMSVPISGGDKLDYSRTYSRVVPV
jgi:hypothetical protein